MIAVDAMGGDHAPHAVVQGALRAAQKGISIQLYGDEQQIVSSLSSFDPHWEQLSIQVIHCSQIVGMAEEPSRAVVQKKDASLVRAVHAVVDGSASAVVTAGNSGAALAAGTLIYGRAQGILRPAIGDFLPTHQGEVFCIDLGANTDCKPEYLEQFALMGCIYVRMMRGISAPRIALLSNGSEAYKGSALVKEVYRRLEKSELNFVGNIESRDIFDFPVEVIVCDGFSGNIVLKAIQGTLRAMTQWVERETARSWFAWPLKLFGGTLLGKFKNKVDYRRKGGALLLGVNHPLIIAHGCSQEIAIENAILYAHQVAHKKIVSQFNNLFAQSAGVIHKSSVSKTVSRCLKSVLRLRRRPSTGSG